MALPKDPADLSGMNPAQAKEYIWRHLASLKATEKEIEAAKAPRDTWAKRVELARSKGMADLEAAAGVELGKAQAALDKLESEAAELRDLVERMRRNLTGVKARERSIDADYLVADMDLALGGDGSGSAVEKGKTERAFGALGNESSLDALKRGMGIKVEDTVPPQAAPTAEGRSAEASSSAPADAPGEGAAASGTAEGGTPA